jgi:hypothetical protein
MTMMSGTRFRFFFVALSVALLLTIAKSEATKRQSSPADGGPTIEQTEADVQQLQKDLRKDNRVTQKDVQRAIDWSREADPAVDSGIRTAQQGGPVEDPDPKASPNATRKSGKP